MESREIEAARIRGLNRGLVKLVIVVGADSRMH